MKEYQSLAWAQKLLLLLVLQTCQLHLGTWFNFESNQIIISQRERAWLVYVAVCARADADLSRYNKALFSSKLSFRSLEL